MVINFAVHLKTNDTRFSQKVLEGLFSHFLYCDVAHDLRFIEHKETDCHFFMELINEQCEWLPVVGSSQSKHEFTVPKLSMNVCKLYLSRILVNCSGEAAVPLGLFNCEVSSNSLKNSPLNNHMSIDHCCHRFSSFKLLHS